MDILADFPWWFSIAYTAWWTIVWLSWLLCAGCGVVWIINKIKTRRRNRMPRTIESHLAETMLDDIATGASQEEYRRSIAVLRCQMASQQRGQQERSRREAGRDTNYPTLLREAREQANGERRILSIQEVAAVRARNNERNSLTTDSERGIIGHNDRNERNKRNKRQEDNMLWFDMLKILRREDGTLALHIYERDQLSLRAKMRVKIESVDEIVDWLWIAYDGDAYIDDKTGEFVDVCEFIRDIIAMHDMEDDIMRAERAERAEPEREVTEDAPVPGRPRIGYASTSSTTSTGAVASGLNSLLAGLNDF